MLITELSWFCNIVDQQTPYSSKLPVGGCLFCVPGGGPGLLAAKWSKVPVVLYCIDSPSVL